jgi:hypothetical protein
MCQTQLGLGFGLKGGVLSWVLRFYIEPSATPWDPSLLFSASQLLWEWGDIVSRLYLILA